MPVLINEIRSGSESKSSCLKITTPFQEVMHEGHYEVSEFYLENTTKDCMAFKIHPNDVEDGGEEFTIRKVKAFVRPSYACLHPSQKICCKVYVGPIGAFEFGILVKPATCICDKLVVKWDFLCCADEILHRQVVHCKNHTKEDYEIISADYYQ